MLRTGQSPAPSRGGLPPPRRRGLARRRECCYRGPWRLPGPDSHRLAAVSLSLGHVVALLLSVLLGAPSYWTHIPTESRPRRWWRLGQQGGEDEIHEAGYPFAAAVP